MADRPLADEVRVEVADGTRGADLHVRLAHTDPRVEDVLSSVAS